MSGDGELLRLMQRYASKGVSDWRAYRRDRQRQETASYLGTSIAGSDQEAQAELKKGASGKGVGFIPMPQSEAAGIEWGFFAARRETQDAKDGWVFDLFLLLPEERHIGFRFEPADRYSDARHGFSHVQLSWRFVHRAVEPKLPLKWLPDSYPAFPIPGRESLDRFLMLVVAMHGYPGGTGDLLRDIEPNRATVVQQCTDRLHGLLG